jgi:galactokinase
MNAAALFAQAFGRDPEATGRASGRVNLLGEHTDYNEGFVLPTALPLMTQVAVGTSRDSRHRFVSGDVDDASAHVEYEADGRPPDGYGRYVHGCIEVLRARGIAVPPVCIAIRSDVPIGSGLSSSAALEVAMLRALRQWLDLDLDDVTIARLGQQAEVEYAGVRVGILDQMAVSIGTPGQLLFLDTRSLESRLVPFPAGSEIAVFDSGVPRTLAESGYNERRRQCEEAARRLGVASLRDVTDLDRVHELPGLLRRRARHVITENLRVLEAATGVDVERFGALMLESHRSLRDDYEVSVPALDALVQVLMEQAGVFGCKLTGAGFGGACVALVAAGHGERIKRDALRAYADRGHRGRILY